MSPEYLQTARELAGESIVLLKNDRQILPLQKTGKIAVIGPMGNTRGELFGTWVMLREEARHAAFSKPSKRSSATGPKWSMHRDRT